HHRLVHDAVGPSVVDQDEQDVRPRLSRRPSGERRSAGRSRRRRRPGGPLHPRIVGEPVVVARLRCSYSCARGALRVRRSPGAVPYAIGPSAGDARSVAVLVVVVPPVAVARAVPVAIAGVVVVAIVPAVVVGTPAVGVGPTVAVVVVAVPIAVAPVAVGVVVVAVVVVPVMTVVVIPVPVAVALVGFLALVGLMPFVGLVGLVAFMGFVGLLAFVGFVVLMPFVGFLGLMAFVGLVTVVSKGGVGGSEKDHAAQECRSHGPLEHRPVLFRGRNGWPGTCRAQT